VLLEPTANLVYESMTCGVVVLAWPAQASEREQLELRGKPRLWLVEPGADAPIGDSCLEDWLRLPAEDQDAHARLVALAHRASHHPQRPALDEHGQFEYRGTVVLLSPVEQHLARPLVDNFGSAVTEEQLLRSAWADGGHDQTLRVHVSRLRRRLLPAGVTVVNIRAYGYVMRAVGS